MRFGKPKRVPITITNAMLTNALKELEGDRLAHREQYNEIPPGVECSLAKKGQGAVTRFLRRLPVGNEVLSLETSLKKSQRTNSG